MTAYCSYHPTVEEVPPRCLLHAPWYPGEVSEIPRNTNIKILSQESGTVSVTLAG